MLVLLTYDVDFTCDGGAKRLRKVAKVCENYGVRVQNSVFELLVDPAQLAVVKAKLQSVIDAEKDSIRLYRLGNRWETKIEAMGAQNAIQQGDTLIL